MTAIQETSAPTNHVHIKPIDFYLCGHAETYLSYSLHDQTAVILHTPNAKFVVKFNGYLAGVCTQVAAPGSQADTPKLGYWYLFHPNLQDFLNLAFDSGFAQVHVSQGIIYDISRPLLPESIRDLFPDLRVSLQDYDPTSLPETIPHHGELWTRHDYRILYQEPLNNPV